MRAAIALGSNLPSRFGDSAATLAEAVRRLGDLGQVLAVSRLILTAPVGLVAQPHFLNDAALLRTNLGPLELLQGLLTTERTMGRVRATDLPPKGPRPVDLDLLLYEDDNGHGLILEDPALTLPHPEMERRAFVLQPLAEIAAGMRHPVLNQTVEQLLHRLAEATVPSSR